MELFKLAGTILIEAKEAIEALQEVSDEAKNAGKTAEKMGEDFKDGGRATENSLEEIAKQSGKTADEVKKDAEKLAKKYEDAGDDSETAMKKAFAEMKKDSAKSTKSISLDFDKVAKSAAGVVSAIVAAAEAIVALAENSREYRVEMSKLETAFLTAGFSADSATATYRTLYSVLGETDQAVEAANMLARLCDSEEELEEMANACIGAYATFGNSLPIEGLAEAANETAKVGTVTGQLADALNWMGVSEDEFNEKLAKCNTERERAKLISEELNAIYGEATEVYLENNKAITEAYLAQEQLNAEMAEFGEKAEYAATQWTKIKTFGLGLAGSYLESLEPAGLRVLHNIQERIGAIGTEFGKTVATPFAEMAKATDAIAEAEAAAYKKSSDITTQYVTDAQALFEQFAATYEGIYSRVSGFFDPFEKASVSVQTNVTKMMEAMQSQIDFNNQYADNLQKLKEYGLGALAEEFQAYGAEGSAYAKAIVDAVEKAGGANTEAAQKIIQNFTAMNEKVAESQGELTETMALMNGEFETELQSMVDDFGVAIEDMDMSSEAAWAAKSTFESFLEEMNSQTPKILENMRKFGSEILTSLYESMGGVSFTITPSFDRPHNKDGNVPPGHEDGLNFVPYDNYLAYLHHGEAVLTAEEAAAWRAGKKSASGGDPGSGGGFVVNQYIESIPQTPAELASATAAYFEQARWVT